jgi:hypothetical protein
MTTNTMVAIQTYTVSGSSTTLITFNSIPQTYTDLVIVQSGSEPGGADSGAFQFNGDTGTNYSYTILSGNGSSASSSRASNTNLGGALLIGTGQSISIANIMNYANTTTYKTWLSRGNAVDNSTRAYVGTWRSTSAITSLTITYGTALSAGSTFTLYGI